MQLENLTKEQFIRDFKDTLHQEQLIKVAKATPTEIFTALAGLIRKYYTNTWIERNHALSDNQEKIAYYFSIEFLPGRMLETNLLNLGILDLVKEGFAELDIDFREVVEAEHDMALGNGGLGRLAAAFMDSLATTGYPGFGNGLRYRYGLFKQRIVDGYQVELPDGWFGSTGNVWETRKDHDIVYVKLFGDVVLESDEDGRFVPTYKNAQVLRAVPPRRWSLHSQHGDDGDPLLRGGTVAAAVGDEKHRGADRHVLRGPSRPRLGDAVRVNPIIVREYCRAET